MVKMFKRKYEAKLEFPAVGCGGGGGVKPEKISGGEVWIFSGTTQFVIPLVSFLINDTPF